MGIDQDLDIETPQEFDIETELLNEIEQDVEQREEVGHEFESEVEPDVEMEIEAEGEDGTTPIEFDPFDEAGPFSDERFESGIADVEAAQRIEDRILGGDGGSNGGRRSPEDIERDILDGI